MSRAFVITGPSGVGKGTILKEVVAQLPDAWYSVSMTTRAPRPGEVDGVHYHFVTPERFDELVAAGEMLEWAWVHKTHRYGTPRQPVLDALEAGKVPILELDLAGAHQIRESMPDAFHIFIDAPSWEELVERLVGRGTEGPEERERRLETARVERASRGEFDAVVVNDSVSRATEEILQIIAAAR